MYAATATNLLATVGEHSVPGIDLVGLLKKHFLLILKLKTPLKKKGTSVM